MQPEPTVQPDTARPSDAYDVFGRDEWSRLRLNTPLTLSSDDITALRGLADPLSRDEVANVYLPLSRLLNLHVRAARRLGTVEHIFLGRDLAPPPYIVGIAGSVAVGKSTFARVLQRLLASWPDHPSVDLVTTDSFLYPRAVLEQRGLMDRKGFPESYDLRGMLAFLAAVKAGTVARAPIYSHFTYDIVPGEQQVVNRPDILLFEGLNVLQTVRAAPLLASDFFDFSVYMDADEDQIATWYAERFLLLQRTAFQQPSSYFHHFRDLSRDEALAQARAIWNRVNLPNLRENIRPTASAPAPSCARAPTTAPRRSGCAGSEIGVACRSQGTSYTSAKRRGGPTCVGLCSMATVRSS